MEYHLMPLWYVQGGAFEDDYLRAVRYGYNFGDTGASGVQVLGEVAHRSEFTDERYPANMELGVEYNTRSGRSNEKGAGALSSPRTTAYDYAGGGVLFFQRSKVVWRGAALPHSLPKNIAVYGSIDVAVDKPQPIDMDALVGVNMTGFLPGRPSDIFEVEAHYQRLSQIEANFETLAQRRLGSLGTQQPRNNFVIEVADKIQLTRWASLSPLAQYFTAPDNYEVPFHPNRPHDGFMAGFIATISLGPALGTSTKPF